MIWRNIFSLRVNFSSRFSTLCMQSNGTKRECFLFLFFLFVKLKGANAAKKYFFFREIKEQRTDSFNKKFKIFPLWNHIQFFSLLYLHHGHPLAQFILSKFPAVFGPCCFKHMQFWPLMLGSWNFDGKINPILLLVNNLLLAWKCHRT